MPGTLPAYVVKDNTLFIDKDSKIGQVKELTLPVVEFKTEEMRNGGMIKPREVRMGLTVSNASFTLVGFDPQVLGLYGVAPGTDKPIIAYGYLQDEDGTEHSARCEMMAAPKKFDPGTWTPGEPAPVETEWAANSYRLFVDDEEVAYVDDFTARFGGVEVFPGRTDALRLA